ncbi:MAG: HupE/UreJ family protein [Pseudomonadota bacterium]
MTVTRLRASWLVGLAALLCAGTAFADVFRPAYLEFRELDAERYAMLWKLPAATGNRRLAMQVVLPEGVEVLSEPQFISVDGALIERSQFRLDGGLAGHEIRIVGAAVGVTDVIARVERLDGSSQVERLPVDRLVFTVEAPAGTGRVAWSYLVLGFEHILGGIDHLLFVLALLLLVHGWRRIVATVTAFTVAHSITLVAATLGWVQVPGAPVEAIIALSIVFVASEFLHSRQGRPGLTERAPWVVAFSFGLLHGFGFAGALAEVGLPAKAIPVALATFNVGVELGQLAFVAVVLLLRRIATALAGASLRWVPSATAYGIGTVAAFWTIERIASFWS